MPCMGPGRNESGAERLFTAILETIHKEGFLNMPEDELVYSMLCYRKAWLGVLETVVAEVVYQDACETF